MLVLLQRQEFLATEDAKRQHDGEICFETSTSVPKGFRLEFEEMESLGSRCIPNNLPIPVLRLIPTQTRGCEKDWFLSREFEGNYSDERGNGN